MNIWMTSLVLLCFAFVTKCHKVDTDDFPDVGARRLRFGPVIPRSELEKVDNTLEDEEKRKLSFDTIIAAAQLTMGVLEKVLNVLSSIERVVAIGISNKSGYNWKAINTYYFSGTSDEVLPAQVKNNEAVLYPARKTKGPTATGAVGVLCYYVPDKYKSICVLFSVPADYNLYSNWWDVRVYDGKHSADYATYKSMYYGNPYKGNDAYHDKDLGSGLSLTDGVMTSGGRAKLMLTITK